MNRSWEKIRVRLFVRLGVEMSEVPLDLFVKKRDRPSLLEVASVSFLCKCYSLRVLPGIIDMHCFFLSNSEYVEAYEAKSSESGHDYLREK